MMLFERYWFNYFTGGSLSKLRRLEDKPFLDPVVSEDLVDQVNRTRIGFSKKTNTYISGAIKFDFNYGIAYCNGYIAFRVISGTPVLVKNLMGAKKEIKQIRKILDILKIKPKEIECKYGLCRINEEIRDLVLEKKSLNVGRDTLYSIDSLRHPFLSSKNEAPSYKIKLEEKKVIKIKKLIGI
jgi:hypothetical protein